MSKSLTLSQISFFMLTLTVDESFDRRFIQIDKIYKSIYSSDLRAKRLPHLHTPILYICVPSEAIPLSAKYLYNDMGNDNCDSMTKFGRRCRWYQRMTRYYRNKSDTIFFLSFHIFIMYSKCKDLLQFQGFVTHPSEGSSHGECIIFIDIMKKGT